jgi:hypothetical protein
LNEKHFKKQPQPTSDSILKSPHIPVDGLLQCSLTSSWFNIFNENQLTSRSVRETFASKIAKGKCEGLAGKQRGN